MLSSIGETAIAISAPGKMYFYVQHVFEASRDLNGGWWTIVSGLSTD